MTDRAYGASGNSPPEVSIFSDPKIDLLARGVYVTMLADPWKDTAEAIAGPNPPYGQGIKPVYRALQLLDAQGYVERATRRNKSNGQTFQGMAGYPWCDCRNGRA
jgi:hypothetical protein